MSVTSMASRYPSPAHPRALWCLVATLICSSKEPVRIWRRAMSASIRPECWLMDPPRAFSRCALALLTRSPTTTLQTQAVWGVTWCLAASARHAKHTRVNRPCRLSPQSLSVHRQCLSPPQCPSYVYVRRVQCRLTHSHPLVPGLLVNQAPHLCYQDDPPVLHLIRRLLLLA